MIDKTLTKVLQSSVWLQVCSSDLCPGYQQAIGYWPCCVLVVGRYFAGSPRTPSCHSGNHPYKIQIILPEIYVFKSNKYTIRGWLNNSYGDDINARYWKRWSVDLIFNNDSDTILTN